MCAETWLHLHSEMAAGQHVAAKVMENIADNIEEIEEEFMILRDLSLHPNIPSFYGLFLKKASRREEDQLYFSMEVTQLELIICLHHATFNRNAAFNAIAFNQY